MRIKKTCICVDATPGSDIYDCIAAAIIMAMQEDVQVRLVHNSKVYRAYPKDIRTTVTEQENEE